MAPRKGFPLRLDPRIYEALRRWADDELRSVNAQIELVVRDALRAAGRWPDATGKPGRKSPEAQDE
jgi:hypothetical protein